MKIQNLSNKEKRSNKEKGEETEVKSIKNNFNESVGGNFPT